jgi:hypothetical protein
MPAVSIHLRSCWVRIAWQQLGCRHQNSSRCGRLIGCHISTDGLQCSMRRPRVQQTPPERTQHCFLALSPAPMCIAGPNASSVPCRTAVLSPRPDVCASVLVGVVKYRSSLTTPSAGFFCTPPVRVAVQRRVVAQRRAPRHGQQRRQVPRLLHWMPCSVCNLALRRVRRPCSMWPSDICRTSAQWTCCSIQSKFFA